MPPVFIDNTDMPSTDPAPVQSAEALGAPDDDTDIGPFRGIYVGVSGTVQLLHVGDTVAVTYTNVPVGLYPWAFRRLGEATTATGLVGQR